ncbi:agamous-like MADS-box protein AGL19 [Vicia villosa]|uniref:agamous-like MADS-box protein AGL19 n=1 Tax=Vicia villosa TaxID=3911 RepID=UPI00273B1F18|nr:agamous-like MADS-box protein AGL19 [Vicia villosa]
MGLAGLLVSHLQCANDAVLLGRQMWAICGLLSINKTVERYQRKVKDLPISTKEIQDNTQNLKECDIITTNKLDQLEHCKRKLLVGDELDTCGIEELQQIENQLECSLSKIRARKEMYLLQENRCLHEKCGIEEGGCLSEQDMGLNTKSVQGGEVETELFIGRPGKQMH